MVGKSEPCDKIKNNSTIQQIITNRKDNVDRMGEYEELSLS
jgi:hypothetical protein